MATLLTRLGTSFNFGQLNLKTILPVSHLKWFSQTCSSDKSTDKQAVSPVAIDSAPLPAKDSNSTKLLIDCGNFAQICSSKDCNNKGSPTKKQLELCAGCTEGENVGSEGMCREPKKQKKKKEVPTPRKCRKDDGVTKPCTVPGPPSEYPKRRRRSFQPKEPQKP